MDPLKIDTVRLSEAGDALVIIDQTLLPNEVRYLRLRETEDICEAIRMLRVRGAPAIGVAAAFGAYLAARFAPDEQLPLFFAYEAGVLLEGGNMFVQNSDGFIRLNLACPRAILEEGLRRICQAVNTRHTGKYLGPA